MYNQSLQKSNSPIIDSLIEEFEDVFVGSDGKLGLTDYVTHHIELKPNSKPFSQYPYHASPIKSQALAEIIKKQLRQDVIEPSSLGDWNAPAFHVNKSTAGSYRLVVDYRKLNACTRPQFCAIRESTKHSTHWVRTNQKYLVVSIFSQDLPTTNSGRRSRPHGFYDDGWQVSFQGPSDGPDEQSMGLYETDGSAPRQSPLQISLGLHR